MSLLFCQFRFVCTDAVICYLVHYVGDCISPLLIARSICHFYSFPSITNFYSRFPDVLAVYRQSHTNHRIPTQDHRYGFVNVSPDTGLDYCRCSAGMHSLPYPTLFNIFLERAMREALECQKGSVSIGEQIITNFGFTDDSVVNAEEQEACDIEASLDTTCTRYMMEFGSDKTKLMTNNPDGFQKDIKIKDQRLELRRGETLQISGINNLY